MVSSCVIGRRNAAWTDYRGVKAFLSHALFGWSRAGTYSTERKKRANCLSVCWMCETIWDFSPRSTIRAINDSWEIFRRHFRMSHSLLPSEPLAVNGKLRRCNEFWRHSHLGCGADGHLACWLWIVGQGRPPAPQAEKPVLLLA